MKISDFYSVRPNSLPVRQILRAGRVDLELQPLTVAQCFRLWDTFRPYLNTWCEFLLASSKLEGEITEEQAAKLDTSWIEPVYRLGFYILWESRGTRWINSVLKAAHGSELSEVYGWFAREHDWPRILRELFGITVDEEGEVQDGGRVNPLLVLFDVEHRTGRRIEDLLAMRVESYLSYIQIAEEWARESRQEGETVASKGKVNGVSKPHQYLGLGVPGVAQHLTKGGERIKSPVERQAERFAAEAETGEAN